jgi:hypothetical protein
MEQIGDLRQARPADLAESRRFGVIANRAASD